MLRYCIFILFAFFACIANAQQNGQITLVDVDSGWAHNSINAVIFRRNSLVSYKDTQFIAYYDKEGYVVIGKRRAGDKNWKLTKTIYKGKTTDAHNCISIMVDGAGYLHVSWDHHNNPLNYCRSKYPGSLELTGKLPMTGSNEQKVSYPEFYKLPDGDLLFLYRDGASGEGNLVLNRYDLQTREWKQVHANLIDGQNQRNAYWQGCIDKRGIFHLSWVWRETPDVASNHDMCYAQSKDGGRTWTRSNGVQYQLPITAATAEYACRIPQKMELINQTSMSSDAAGHVYIASYWREQGDSIPQYHLIYQVKGQWKTMNMGFRKTAFSLSGMGTRRIPISRPQVIAWNKNKEQAVGLIFRDAERGNKVSLAICNNLKQGKWEIKDLYSDMVGSWEPTYDTELWKEKGIVSLFVQHVEQADAEGTSQIPPQIIKVLDWKPAF